mmetsp:Transcript_13354/g.52302  ORF Transcript_13354/g.52302 Transcript_13354/m.52302 type:complete len:251 (-) Transcript_13354:3000-3752(-)
MDATLYIAGYLAASVAASSSAPGPQSTSGAGKGTGGGGSGGATVSVIASLVGSGESTWIIFAPGPRSCLSSLASRFACANTFVLNATVKSSAVRAKSSTSTQTAGLLDSGFTISGSLTDTQHRLWYTHASSTSYSSSGSVRGSVTCRVSCSRSSRVTKSSTFWYTSSMASAPSKKCAVRGKSDLTGASLKSYLASLFLTLSSLASSCLIVSRCATSLPSSSSSHGANSLWNTLPVRGSMRRPLVRAKTVS